MSEKTWSPADLIRVHEAAPPETFVIRRRLGHALRKISEELIRIEATDEELGDWAQQAEQLLAQIAGHEHRDLKQSSKRLWMGQATTVDIFDMRDYDPIGGEANPIAPLLNWHETDGTEVEAHINLGQQYQGPPGRVHGGVIGWILDAVLARVMHKLRTFGVTGTLNLRYMAASPINSDLQCRAWLVKQEGRKLFIEGGIFYQGEQCVKAEAVFFQPAWMVKPSA